MHTQGGGKKKKGKSSFGLNTKLTPSIIFNYKKIKICAVWIHKTATPRLSLAAASQRARALPRRTRRSVPPQDGSCQPRRHHERRRDRSPRGLIKTGCHGLGVGWVPQSSLETPRIALLLGRRQPHRPERVSIQ